nr:DUF2341 domain-containing protein [Candidatus Sigynarchaeota archaeon]
MLGIFHGDAGTPSAIQGTPLPSTNGYLYTKIVNISPATPFTDYALRLDINSTFNYGDCQADGDDIRFVDLSDAPLSFWTEKWTNGGDSIIWIKIPQAGTSSIKMLYGNDTIGSASNGEATFPLFDDFSGAIFNTSKWTAEGDNYSTTTVVSGMANLYSFAPSSCISFALAGICDGTMNHGVTYGAQWYNGVIRISEDLNSLENGTSTITKFKKNQTWILMDYQRINSSFSRFQENDTLIATHITNVPDISLPVTFMGRSVEYGPGYNYGAVLRSNSTFGPGYAMRSLTWIQYDFRLLPTSLPTIIYIDWVLVRKCAAVEPIASFEHPHITVSSPANNQIFSTNDVPLTIETSSPSINSIWYILDGGSSVTLTTNTTISVADGSHIIVFHATDTSGEESSVTRSFTVDATSPLVSITSPVDGALLSSGNVNVTFTTTDVTKNETWYTLNGGNATIVSGTNIPLTLVDGIYTLVVYCKDGLNRIGSNCINFIIDTVAPEILIIGFNGTIIQQGDVENLNWMLIEAHPATYALLLNGQVIKSGSYTSGDQVSVQIDASIVGSLNYTMIARDIAGNEQRLQQLITSTFRTDGGIFLTVGINHINHHASSVTLTFNMSYWAVLYLDVDPTLTTASQILPDPELPGSLVIALPVAFNINITNGSALQSCSIRIHYDQAIIASMVNEQDMTVLRWNADTLSWSTGMGGLNRVDNYVDISLAENGLYIIASTPKHNYIPIISILLVGITGGIVAVLGYSYSRKKTVSVTTKGLGKRKHNTSYTDAHVAPDNLIDHATAKRTRLMQQGINADTLVLPSTSLPEVPLEPGKKKAGRASEPAVDIAARATSAHEMASEVKVERVVSRCIVHKGPISGFSYTCKHCGTVYCMKCVEHMIEIGEQCWSCKQPILLDGSKYLVEPLPKITVGKFSPEVWQKIRVLNIPEEIFDEVIGELKDLPPTSRIKYLEDTFKDNEDLNTEL